MTIILCAELIERLGDFVATKQGNKNLYPSEREFLKRYLADAQKCTDFATALQKKLTSINIDVSDVGTQAAIHSVVKSLCGIDPLKRGLFYALPDSYITALVNGIGAVGDYEVSPLECIKYAPKETLFNIINDDKRLNVIFKKVSQAATTLERYEVVMREVTVELMFAASNDGEKLKIEKALVKACKASRYNDQMDKDYLILDRIRKRIEIEVFIVQKGNGLSVNDITLLIEKYSNYIGFIVETAEKYQPRYSMARRNT